MRTALTIMGISVGIGTILFLVSLGYGLQRLILSQITTSDALLSLDVTTGDVEGLKLNNESLANIKRISTIEKISPVVTLQAQMNIDNISTELSANVVDREFFQLEGTTLKKGEFYEDIAEDKNKIIITSAALNLFDLNEDNAFDKEINFSVYVPADSDENEELIRDYSVLSYKFKIIAIIDEENSNYVYIPYMVSQELGADNYAKLKVKVNNEDNLNIAREEIIDQGYMVSALSDIIEQANQIFKVVQIVLALFGVIALIVSAIGMFNTMTIALLERTQEIGIMKAMGASDMDIWNMFLGESFLMGFLGGTGGILIGMLGGEVFNYGLNFLAGALGGEKIDLFYTPIWFILLILSFGAFVGLGTGFYPASRAAKINCLEALRYK